MFFWDAPSVVKKKSVTILREGGRVDGRATGSRTISLCPPNRMGGGGGGLPSAPRLLHHASHDTRGGSAQRWVKRQRGRERGGSAGQREFFDRQTESGGVGRDRGRKSEGNTGPDAFLIDGPKNLCEGRLLCFDVALIGRRGSKPNPDWEGGRREAAGEPRIHHGGGGGRQSGRLTRPHRRSRKRADHKHNSQWERRRDAARNIIQGRKGGTD